MRPGLNDCQCHADLLFGFSNSVYHEPSLHCTQNAKALMYMHKRNYRVALQFTWDERKNRINKRKHGVGFETAVLVFDDPYHVSRLDREVAGELRWQTIGMVKGMQVLLVAHTMLEFGNAEVARVISARKATPQERSIYAQDS